MVPPLTPPRPVPQLLVSDEKTLTSTHVSSPLSPVQTLSVSAMSTTWPSLNSLNCLVRAPCALSPSTVCVVATAEMALYQAATQQQELQEPTHLGGGGFELSCMASTS